MSRSSFIALLAMLMLTPACVRSGESGTDKQRKPGSSQAAKEATAVRTAPVRTGSIDYRLNTTGDLTAEDATDLVVRRSGVIERILVEEGAVVSKGDVLLELDRREAEIALAQSKNEENEAAKRAELSRESITASENALAQARIAAEKADAEYRRYSGLSRGVVQHEELATRAYEQQRTRLSQEAAAGDLRQARINAVISDNVAAAAALKSKKALLDVEFTRLTAPFAGVISVRHVQRGQFLAANSRAFTVVDAANLKLEVNLPQRYLRKLKPGLSVLLETEAYPGTSYPARMERVSTVIGEKGTVKVTIRVHKPDGTLRPGMYVSASIVLDTHADTLLTPKRGVQYDTLGGSPHVFVVRNGIAYKLPVKIGFREADEVETLPMLVPMVPTSPPLMGAVRVFGVPIPMVRLIALRADDQVIVAGQDKLRGGEEVRAVNTIEPRRQTEADDRAPDESPPTEPR